MKTFLPSGGEGEGRSIIQFTISEKLFQNNNAALGSKRDNKYHNNNGGVDNTKAQKGVRSSSATK